MRCHRERKERHQEILQCLLDTLKQLGDRLWPRVSAQTSNFRARGPGWLLLLVCLRGSSVSECTTELSVPEPSASLPVGEPALGLLRLQDPDQPDANPLDLVAQLRGCWVQQNWASPDWAAAAVELSQLLALLVTSKGLTLTEAQCTTVMADMEQIYDCLTAAPPSPSGGLIAEHPRGTAGGPPSPLPPPERSPVVPVPPASKGYGAPRPAVPWGHVPRALDADLALAQAEADLPEQDPLASLTEGDADRCVAGATLLYTAARRGDTAKVSRLLNRGDHASLLVAGPGGNYPLHAAACARAPACIALLLDRHIALDRRFDPAHLRNAVGDTPMDVAGGHDEALQALYVGLPARPSALHNFHRSTVHEATQSAAIGDHNVAFSRDDVPLTALVQGIVAEERAVLEGAGKHAEWQAARDRWLGQSPVRADWQCHVTAAAVAERLTRAWDTHSEDALFRMAVYLYTLESFLRRAVNAAGCARGGFKEHLQPFLKLLHCALRGLPMPARHCHNAYWSLQLTDEEQVPYYTSHRHDPLGEFFSFDGFLSVSTSAQVAIRPPPPPPYHLPHPPPDNSPNSYCPSHLLPPHPPCHSPNPPLHSTRHCCTCHICHHSPRPHLPMPYTPLP